jgi:tetratricopeptide (TPR) repeat protein
MEKETLLYKYFENTLSPEEQEFFDELLKKDPDFQEQVRFEEDLKRVVIDKERLVLKKKLQEFEAQLEKTGSRKNIFWKPLRIAASIALLFVAGWYFYTTSFSATPEELYASNYEIYPNTVYPITRGDGNDVSLERKAFESYEKNDIKVAIGLFEELSERSGLDYVDFYLAQMYLANNEIPRALNKFQSIISEENDFKTEALWYASLCKLKLNRPKEAIPLLEKLVEDGSYKKQASVSLLKKLR